MNSTEEYLDRLLKGALTEEPAEPVWENTMPSFDDLMQLEEATPDYGDGPIKVGLPVYEEKAPVVSEPINTGVNIFTQEPVISDSKAFEEIIDSESIEPETIEPETIEIPELDISSMMAELEQVPIVEEMPSLEEIPVIEEMPSLEEIPVIDETPSFDASVSPEEPGFSDELSILENKLDFGNVEIGEDLQEMNEVPADIEALLKDIDNMGNGEFTEPIAAEDTVSDIPLYTFENDLGEIEFPTGASEEPEDKSDSLDDVDLNTLLSDLAIDDADMAEIGNILSKDENNEIIPELLDTNSNDSDVNPADEFAALLDGEEEDEAQEGKKKKKKKVKKEKKKRKKGEESIDPDLQEISLDEDGEDVKPKEKKKGLFAKIIEAFTESDEDDLLDEGDVKFEESAVDIAKEGAEENEKLLEELENEPEDKKGKKKKKKKKGKGGDVPEGEESDEEGTPKKDKKAEKAAKKAEKAAKKAQQKELEASMPKKKLPKKKVIPICILCFSFGVVITLLAFMLPTARDKKKALENFQYQNYEDTYQLLKGHKLNESEKLLYNRTVVLLKEERKLDSYRNYMSLGMKSNALNALVQGVKNSQELSEKAEELGVLNEYNQIYANIISELNSTFGLSEDKVKEWIQIEDSEQYAYVINNFLSTGNADVISQMEGTDGANEASDFNVWDNTIISAEEAEFNDSNY